MSKNRELAERLMDKLRPRIVDALVELLDAEQGVEDEQPHRVPGISPEGYARAAAAVARWSGGGRKAGKVRRAG